MPTAARYQGPVEYDAAATFDSTSDFNGAVTFDAAVDCDAAVDLVGASVVTAHRELAADAACVVAATDDTIELNKTTGTTAVTMTATGAGHKIHIYLGVRSGGDATIACTRGATAGTVTLDAVGEGAILKYNGTAWKLVQLTGGATFA
jgi:hypothetical protein